MAELTPAQKYRLESLRNRKVTTERDIKYHEAQKTKHDMGVTTGAINLKAIEEELKKLESKEQE